jgi:hypothetical protein
MKEVRFTVVDSAVVRLCEGGGDGIRLSATYDAVLPFEPLRNQVIAVPVSEQAGPDEVDKFSVVLGLPGETLEPAHLYRLRIALIYDEGKSIDVGTAIVSLPDDPSLSAFNPGLLNATLSEIAANSALESPCYRQNILITSRFTKGPGIRTPAMQAITEAFSHQ